MNNAFSAFDDALDAAVDEVAASVEDATVSNTFPTQNDTSIVVLATSGQLPLTDDILSRYVDLAARTSGSSQDALAYYEFLSALLLGYQPHALLTVNVPETEASTESFYRPQSISKYYNDGYTLCWGRRVPLDIRSSAVTSGQDAIYVYSDVLIGTDGVAMSLEASDGVVVYHANIGPFVYRISRGGRIQVRLGTADDVFTELQLLYQLGSEESYTASNNISVAILHDGPSEDAFATEDSSVTDHTNIEPEEGYIVPSEDGLMEGQVSATGILYLDDLDLAGPVIVDRVKQARVLVPDVQVRIWNKKQLIGAGWVLWSTDQDTVVAAEADGPMRYTFNRTLPLVTETNLDDEPMSLQTFGIIVAGATVAVTLAILTVKGVLGTDDNRVHLVIDQ